MQNIKHIKIKVYGKVQGVGFRFFICRWAEYFNIKGFVKNKSDGSVYMEVEGYENSLNELIKKCKKGPRLSSVKELDIKEGKVNNFQNFEIKH